MATDEGLCGMWRTTAGSYILWRFLLGWAIVLTSTFLINHFDLFGLRQVYLHLKGMEHHTPDRDAVLLKLVRIRSCWVYHRLGRRRA